jgi:3-methyladenine DNA glycosylase/8-oxoguanine DNA glycosylase
MVCTTNCSWALTTIMVRNLCQALGTETPRGKRTFPSPAAIAGQSEAFLRKEIRAGYRAPYILELSELAASGKVDMEAFRRSGQPTDELYHELRALKGVGPYAAESLLKLLGRYDHLGLDSWTRKRYGQIYHNGRKVTDRTIERRYRQYGTWAGLVFWLEMTKEWYEGEVVF